MQPLEEFLKTSVGQNSLHRIERVAKFIVAPGLVDEILARMTGRRDLGSAFAARNHVMSTCRDLPFTESAFRSLSFDFRVLISRHLRYSEIKSKIEIQKSKFE